MGQTQLKQTANIINNVITRTTTNILNRTITNASTNVTGTQKLEVYFGSNVHCDPGSTIDQTSNADVSVLNSIKNVNITDLKDEINKALDLNNDLGQSLSHTIGGNWGSNLDSQQDITIKNTVEDIINKNITNETINTILNTFSFNQDGKIVFGDGYSGPCNVAQNMIIKVVVDNLSDTLTQSIVDNQILQDIAIKNTVTQTVEESLFGNWAIILVLIVGIVFFIYIFTKLKDVKMILLILFGIGLMGLIVYIYTQNPNHTNCSTQFSKLKKYSDEDESAAKQKQALDSYNKCAGDFTNHSLLAPVSVIVCILGFILFGYFLIPDKKDDSSPSLPVKRSKKTLIILFILFVVIPTTSTIVILSIYPDVAVGFPGCIPEYNTIMGNSSFKKDFKSDFAMLMSVNPDKIKDKKLKKAVLEFLDKCPLTEGYSDGYIPKVVDGIQLNPPWISGNNRKQLRYNKCFNTDLF